MDIIDITGMILLVGFIGKKMKDSGYDWNDYDWDQKDPFEIELLGYGCIVLILYFHIFMICIRWQPIFTLLITGVIADAVRVTFNSWDTTKAKLSFLKIIFQTAFNNTKIVELYIEKNSDYNNKWIKKT
ncbi:hypothetical protein CEXT_263671 [Caerostris extrusa]|uniref:Uncharacterized protein n=1 Tax=Caerostris extrusa TaxID=172846 RepID=A0AAV4T9G5_CAEEX|nr:hypothetical protein CEXT_263671 [Caerostris extrusa]